MLAGRRRVHFRPIFILNNKLTDFYQEMTPPGAKTPGFGGRIAAMADLCRPRNCALTALSVWVGAVTSGLPHLTGQVLAAAMAAASIAAAGNGVNDVVDLDVDRINRPGRPLPSGRLTVTAAILISGLLAATGLALAFWVGPAPGAIAAGVLIGLLLYSWRLKASGLPGNLAVGVLAAATFPFGAAAAAGGWGRWWIPAAFALLYHVAREVIKGVEDLEGDRGAGLRTLALARGPLAASRVAAGLLAIVALAAPLPGLLGVYGAAYLAPVAILVLFLCLLAPRLWRGVEPGTTDTGRWLLLGMVLGLAAVVAGEQIDLN